MIGSLRALIILVLMCGCVGCDQATKAIARHQLPTGSIVSVFHGTLLLERAENPGAFLSLGDALPRQIRRDVLTFGGLLLVSAGILWVLASSKTNRIQTAGAALALGGGLSNVIDRLIHGRVTDFLNVGVGSIRTGIFNVADMALMLGVGLWVASSLRAESRGRRANGI
jgi:signal peptidase II